MPTEQAVHKLVGNTIPCIEIVYGFQSLHLSIMSCSLQQQAIVSLRLPRRLYPRIADLVMIEEQANRWG